MNRDHLRLVAANSAPCSVSRMETFSFATVEGGLIILHNDDRITAADALVEITKLLKPELLRSAPGAADAELKLRHMLPGNMGGFDADRASEKPLFAESRHARGYSADRPGPICAETEGDGA